MSRSYELRVTSCESARFGTRNPQPATRNSRGLTLIEVLLAITILGFGIAGLVTAAAKALAVARQAKNYETAREAMARVELEHPLALVEKIEDANDSGSLDSPYNGFSWKREVEPVGLEEDYLFMVTTTIGWADAGKNCSESIVTYVHRPEEKLPGSAAR